MKGWPWMEGYPRRRAAAAHPRGMSGASRHAPSASGQIDIERLRKPLEMADVDALGVAAAGASADRLVHMTEYRQRRVMLVDGLQQARPVHLQPAGHHVVAQLGDSGWDVGCAGINRQEERDENARHRRSSDPRWPRVMRWRPHGRHRMTRGHRGSLLLRCRAFSSLSSCRFIPAHPTFPVVAADQARAAFTPDTVWPVNGFPPDLSRGYPPTSVLMSSLVFRCFINGLLSLAFLIPA